MTTTTTAPTPTKMTTYTQTRRSLLLAMFGSSAAIAAAACTGPAGVAGLPCPCTDGYVCCEAYGGCYRPGELDEESCKGVATEPESAGNSTSTSSGSTPPPDRLRVALAKNESPRCLVQDKDNLYWQNADGKIAGIPKSGGAVVPSRFATTPQPTGACGLVIDEGSIYATMYGLGSIAKVSLETSGPLVIGSQGTVFGSLLTPSSLAIDASYIYVTELDSGAIKRLPKAQTGAGADAGAPADGGAVVLGNAGANPHHIVADGEFLYWLDEGGLRRMSKEGGHIVTLSNTRKTMSLSHVDGQLYWNDEKDIWTMVIPGGAPRKLLLLAANSGRDGDGNRTYGPAYSSPLGLLAADRENVFFIGGSNAVLRVSASGGEVESLFFYRDYSAPNATSLSPAAQAEAQNATIAKVFALDAQRFYWLDETTVWSRPR